MLLRGRKRAANPWQIDKRQIGLHQIAFNRFAAGVCGQPFLDEHRRELAGGRVFVARAYLYREKCRHFDLFPISLEALPKWACVICKIGKVNHLEN
jgi:hypothetical protein